MISKTVEIVNETGLHTRPGNTDWWYNGSVDRGRGEKTRSNAISTVRSCAAQYHG